MRQAEEIIDAEFTDLPNSGRDSYKLVKARPVRAKIAKPARQKKTKDPEGRLDILVTGLLAKSYQNMTNSPTPPAIEETIGHAVKMIIGTPKATGREWNFLKSVMKGG